MDQNNTTGENSSNYQYASTLEQRNEGNKYVVRHISVENLQECLEVDKSIKEQIILIMSIRYLFDEKTLQSMHYFKSFRTMEELFQDCFKIYDVCYVLDYQSMYNKTHDSPPVRGKFQQIVVACAFMKIQDQNIEVHYLATRPLYDFLGYASLLLNNTVRSLSQNLRAVKVIIAYYPECTIGVVSPDQIKHLEYPKIRYEKYVKQFINPCTGFIEKMELELSPESEKSWRKSRFYTNSKTIDHEFYYIDGHTFGTKYSRRPLKANNSNFAIHNRNQISHISYSKEAPDSKKGNMNIPEKYKTVSFYDLMKKKIIFKE